MITITDEPALIVREDGKVIKVLTKYNGNQPEIYLTEQAGWDEYKDLIKASVSRKLDSEAKHNPYTKMTEVKNEGTPTKTENKSAK